MVRGTMGRLAFKAAAYSKNGETSGSGPRCATCGDLAAWGAHPWCERKGDRLVVWITEQPKQIEDLDALDREEVMGGYGE